MGVGIVATGYFSGCIYIRIEVEINTTLMIILNEKKLYRHSTSRYVKLSALCQCSALSFEQLKNY